MSSTWRFAFLFGLILGLMMVGCPGDDDDDAADDDSAASDDDDATSDDDDDATSDDDDDDDATSDDDDDSAGNDPNIRVAPPALDLGTVLVGNSRNVNLEIRNVGQGPLEVYDVICSMPQISFTAFVGTIAPGNFEVVPVTGTCTVEEEVSGAMRIRSDDPDSNEVNVPIIMVCDEA